MKMFRFSLPDAGLLICIGDSTDSDQGELARLLQTKYHVLLWSLGHLALYPLTN